MILVLMTRSYSWATMKTALLEAHLMTYNASFVDLPVPSFVFHSTKSVDFWWALLMWNAWVHQSKCYLQKVNKLVY